MKKIFFMILILFLLTGCEATYNLTLDSNNFIENLEINNNKISFNNHDIPYKEMLNNASNGALATDIREEKPESNVKEDNIKYYDVKKIETNNTLGISYENKFSLLEYKYSTIVNSNIDKFNYTYNKEQIMLNITNPINVFVLYPQLNNLTIKFKTNHEVIKNNADEIIDNTYYFYLNKSNYQNKKIILELSNEYNQNTPGFLVLDEEGYFSVNTLIIIYVILGVIGLTIGISIYIKVRKSNN